MSRDKDIEHSLVEAMKSGQHTEHLKRVQRENQLIPHNFKVPHLRTPTCALEGCEETFEITVFPKQLIYPKFCPAHRNEHQREHFLNERSGD